MKLVIAGILLSLFVFVVGCDQQPSSSEASQNQKEINKMKDSNWQD